jgi:hypothetical protein
MLNPPSSCEKAQCNFYLNPLELPLRGSSCFIQQIVLSQQNFAFDPAFLDATLEPSHVVSRHPDERYVDRFAVVDAVSFQDDVHYYY